MTRKPVLPAEVKKVIRSALAPSVSALRRLARYKLEGHWSAACTHSGSARNSWEKRNTTSWCAGYFAERRTIEKLEAKVALQRLNELFPDVAAGK